MFSHDDTECPVQGQHKNCEFLISSTTFHQLVLFNVLQVGKLAKDVHYHLGDIDEVKETRIMYIITYKQLT